LAAQAEPLMHVLIIEDDARLGRMLCRGLAEEGWQVSLAADGESGLEQLAKGGVDVCVLDVLLPGMDGFTTLSRARAAQIKTPVLMLTARDAVPDRVRGLELGADDYRVKPFAFAELVARLPALTRRGAPPARLRAAGIELDPAAHRVTVDGAEVALSARQFALLAFLVGAAGQVVTRAMILERVFGYAFDPGTNIVDVHIANLRQKIDPDGARIQTVRGVGYRLVGDG
jgi:DNA-binding response OmpR family regulator